MIKNPFKEFFGGFEKSRTSGTYIDFAASTPVDSRVLARMEPFFTEMFANPSNRLHSLGEAVDSELNLCRSSVADLLHMSSNGITFLSSATEAINLFIRGLAQAESLKWQNHFHAKRNVLAYLASEHSAVRETILSVCQHNPEFEALCIPVNHKGIAKIQSALTEEKANKILLLCAMDINNETGVYQQELPNIFSWCEMHGIKLFVDSSQGFSRCEDFKNQGGKYSHAYCINSSKIYGPKGCALLVVKPQTPRIKLFPQLTGGGQEFGMRSSTQNIPAIVGFTEAALLHENERNLRFKYIQLLEETFLKEIHKYPNAQVLSHGHGIISVCFKNCNAMKLIEDTRTICVSAGSACKTLQATASEVLLAYGFDVETALSTIRVSFGIPNTQQDAVFAAKTLSENAKVLAHSSATFSL
jgi:cysteine desulfurase